MKCLTLYDIFEKAAKIEIVVCCKLDNAGGALWRKRWKQNNGFWFLTWASSGGPEEPVHSHSLITYNQMFKILELLFSQDILT